MADSESESEIAEEELEQFIKSELDQLNNATDQLLLDLPKDSKVRSAFAIRKRISNYISRESGSKLSKKRVDYINTKIFDLVTIIAELEKELQMQKRLNIRQKEDIKEMVKEIAKETTKDVNKEEIVQIVREVTQETNKLRKEEMSTMIKEITQEITTDNRKQDITEIVKEVTKEISKEIIVEKRNEPNLDIFNSTFAEVTKRQNKIKQTDTGRDHVILIYPTDEKDERTSKQIKDNIVSSIDPTKLQVGIKRVKLIQKGLLIETDTSDNREKMIEEINKSKNLGLVAKKPKKRRPRLIIYDVGKEIDKDELTENLKIQYDFDYDEFLTEFPIKSKFGNHWVISVNPDVFHYLLELGKVNIKWSRCNVKEYFRIRQCFKCHEIGHIAKNCSKEEMCNECSQLHEGNCQELHCINCENSNKLYKTNFDTNHSPYFRECESFLRYEDIERRKIDYG